MIFLINLRFECQEVNVKETFLCLERYTFNAYVYIVCSSRGDGYSFVVPCDLVFFGGVWAPSDVVNFYGVVENVDCEVQYFDLSAHAGHSELIEFARKCNPEKIVLMHSDNREALIDPLKEFSEVIAPKTGELLEL